MYVFSGDLPYKSFFVMYPFFQPIPMLVESICFSQEPTHVFQLVFLLSGLLMVNSNKLHPWRFYNTLPMFLV